jgi:class 3 adenylate cyclase
MPIYMDRHDIKGATHEMLAEAHQKDLKIQDHFGVKLMTYWFDEDRGTAFCLMDAPDEEAVRQMHNSAHGFVPHEVIEVDPSAVEAFLGRIADPPSVGAAPDASGEPKIDPAFRAIMFTDMEGSTTITARLGDEELVELIKNHNAMTRDAVRAHRGAEVKFTGDGFHVSFTSVKDAVKCAVQIQHEFLSYNAKNPDRQVHVKIGVNAGEPIMADHDLFGSTVNLAARICDHAKPDQILVAQVVRDLCLGKGFMFVDQPDTMLKGFDEPVRLSEVSWR